MRAEALLLLVCTACNPQVSDSPDDVPVSVRERLETAETRLLISPEASAGTITAHRRISGGWETALVDLDAYNGELVASADLDGTITIERLDIALDPIAIPSTVFGHDAALTDVRTRLARPARVMTTWTDDDEARVTAVLELDLSWALRVDGNTTPLGAPRLPPVTVELALTGDGEVVQAELRANAAGEVWNWADLIKLEDLNLIIGAATL